MNLKHKSSLTSNCNNACYQIDIWKSISILRRLPYLLFWRKTYPQTFSLEFLSICEYNSWKKLHITDLSKNGDFVRVCTEKVMDHQYISIWKTARETYIQTIIRWELMLNALQINQKNYTLSTFPSSNQRNFEDSGKVLVVSVSEIYRSVAVLLYHPTLIRWLSLLYVYK